MGLRFHESLSEVERAIYRELLMELEDFECQQQTRTQQYSAKPLPGIFASCYTTVQEQFLMRRAEALRDEELDMIIRNTAPNMHYDAFMLTQRKLYELSKDVSQCRHFEFNGDYYAHWSGGSPVMLVNFDRFILNLSDNMEQLIVVLKTLESLRTSVGQAAESSSLTKDELRALRFKLTAFDSDSRYSNARRLVSYALEYEPCLVNTRSKRWW